MLLLVRGIAGAGKSTFARDLQDQYGQEVVAIFENDQFRHLAGEYQFNPKASRAIEAACLAAVSAAMTAGVPLVVLANANTRWHTFSRYLRLAEDQGYCVRQKVLMIDAEIGHARNIHRVPLPIIRNQLKNLENALAAEQQRGALLADWSAAEFAKFFPAA
jgi:predicted kinase